MDYKDTLNLPRTDFPMRAQLAAREPALLEQWAKGRLYERILEQRKHAPKFVLHDGPPFVNGRIHYGHILNKILKDLVIKSRTMAGYLCPYLPGWDCHGLPIELQVEKETPPAKRAQMSKVDIIAACRAYALRFVELQREEFRRLGVFGAWEQSYLTLDPAYEADIVRALAVCAAKGYLYKGRKPVYWCPTDRTSLAEAEVEYENHSSPSIYVKFPLADPSAGFAEALSGKRVSLVIWTTTPWTLPANVAVAVHPEFDYVALIYGDEAYVVAKDLADRVREACQLPVPSGVVPVRVRERTRARHPFLDRDSLVVYSEYVTLEAGTGLVHTAPGHGQEDFEIGQRYGLETLQPVDDQGRFDASVPAFAGLSVYEANPKIVAELQARQMLLNRPGETISHSYPHCWRCKNPILFRATPQWFLSLSHQSLRAAALEEIDRTRWIPPWGKNRIRGMIEHRPDWCLSRQRVWGVPIPAYDCQACGEAILEPSWMERAADLFEKESISAWYSHPESELLPPGARCPKCGGSDLAKEQVIVDVWFESGNSWKAVCEKRAELGLPVDLYLEGSDQHRGWFHTALLTGVAIKGHAPYRAVLTHGFVLDERGKPYSKSEIQKAAAAGVKIEYIPPEEILKKEGAELLRLWVASEDFRSDVRYSRAHLEQLGESYRKLRNTCRFVLGNLFDFQPDTMLIPAAKLPKLDRFALEQHADFVATTRRAYLEYEFHVVLRALIDYCAVDLSAFYFDIVKDRLYCDSAASPSRRGAQTVLYEIGRALATTMAPILAFTAEEIWRYLPRKAGEPDSVHLALFSSVPSERDSELASRWRRLIEFRKAVLSQMEAFRREGKKSLDARVVLTPRAADVELLSAEANELADLFIVSQVEIAASGGDELGIRIEPAHGTRCERCWKWTLQPVGPLCARCDQVVKERR